MKKIGKKGGEKLLSVWWFFVLTIIGLGIMIGVWAYYGYELDNRGIEADILAEKIAGCLVSQGELNISLFDASLLFPQCGLNRNLIDSEKFYFSVSYSAFSGNAVGKIEIGAKVFKTQCDLRKKMSNGGQDNTPKMPKCAEKNIYVSNNGGGKLHILTASNNIGKAMDVYEV